MTDLVLVPTAFEAKHILGTTLSLDTAISCDSLPGSARAALCGFGLPLAAARTAALLAAGSADRVIHLGIAGTYDSDRLPIGSVVSGTWAACRGIGTGQGDRHEDAATLGFDPLAGLDLDGGRIPLSPVPGFEHGGILSVAAASDSPDEAALCRAAYPEALVEDMESYAVALAARLASCELIVLRAVSNVAGVRDKSTWDIPSALDALRLSLARL